MKVLIACEESQAVCKAFRERGHEAKLSPVLQRQLLNSGEIAQIFTQLKEVN